jgi:adenylosuccinate lyase
MIERYQTPEMNELWSDRRRFSIWRDVEVAVCDALAGLGEIPEASARNIRQKADFDPARVLEIEDVVQHDVIAFLTNMAEYIGPDSRYVHLGMTSSDLLDTTLAVQCKEAGEVLLAALDRLRDVVIRRAEEHRHTVCIGRSHGIHAEPTTFGLKLLVWVDELRRGRKRLQAAVDSISVGQISGPVGTFAHIDPRVEALVCERLGLHPAPVSTQVIQRDRHAELLSAMALVGATLEKMSIEVRHLMRTEVNEVEEPFGKGQKGSSAMPHKKNPILSERITGMARILRGNLVAGLENVALWHERDISHSSVERIILPDSTTLLHYMLLKSTQLMDGLRVFPERMQANLDLTRGLWHSGAILLDLARHGISREDAYAAVQKVALHAWETKQDFESLARADARLNELLTPEELDKCFRLDRHLAHVDELFTRVLAQE